MVSHILINKEQCIGCGECVADCPYSAIELDTQRKARMFRDSCLECGHCVAVCPQAAVRMDGYDMGEVIEFDQSTPALDPHRLMNSIRSRRSVRQFTPDEVERKKIEYIIEAGRFTPTGSNKQKNRYIVVEHPERSIEVSAVQSFKKLQAVLDILGRFIRLPYRTSDYKLQEGFFFHGAPAVILVVSEDATDAALASTNMSTMAESLGLGVLYVGFFTRAAGMSKRIRQQLGLKAKEKVVTALAIGYPNVHYIRTAPRKQAEVRWM